LFNEARRCFHGRRSHAQQGSWLTPDFRDCLSGLEFGQDVCNEIVFGSSEFAAQKGCITGARRKTEETSAVAENRSLEFGRKLQMLCGEKNSAIEIF
jgi:hypothetical protein